MDNNNGKVESGKLTLEIPKVSESATWTDVNELSNIIIDYLIEHKIDGKVIFENKQWYIENGFFHYSSVD